MRSLTRAIFGAAAFWSTPQKETDAVLDILLEYGVNHIDTAASYGDAEKRLGPWMPRHRDQFFLATKTEERTRQGARARSRHLDRAGRRPPGGLSGRRAFLPHGDCIPFLPTCTIVPGGMRSNPPLARRATARGAATPPTRALTRADSGREPMRFRWYLLLLLAPLTGCGDSNPTRAASPSKARACGAPRAIHSTAWRGFTC